MASELTAWGLVALHCENLTFHRVNHAGHGRHQFMNMTGMAVNVAVVAGVGAIDEVVQVVGQFIELLQIGLKVMKRNARIMSEAVDMFRP